MKICTRILCIGMIVSAGRPARSGEGRIGVKEVRCEYRLNPVGLDRRRPRFSWVLESTRRGQMQSAYRILVASSEDKLRSNAGDKWDSGKVISGKSINVPYDGKALGSGETCCWKVRAWDANDRPGDYSISGTFEMGLLEQTDWQGEWIGMAPPGTAPDYAAGRFGRSVLLDGRSESVKTEHYDSLKPKAAITISAWVKPDGELGDGWREIYRKEDGEARQLLALGKTGNTWGVWLGLGINGSYVERGAATSPHVLQDGKWHFIAATYDGSSERFHVDGKEIGSAAVRGSLDTSGTSPAYIGSWGGNQELFAGGIDDVRIYGRALTAAEIRAMTRKLAGKDPALVGWWKFDGNLDNSAHPEKARASVSSKPSPSSVLLRKEFEIAGGIRRARAYISGLGWYELSINGKKVGDHVLDPATTDYDKRALYATYDVTPYLQQGTNAIGIFLGNGWYCEPGRLKYGDSPRARMQLRIDLSDGTRTRVATDTSWKAANGPITRNDIYGGETYDARLERPGWNTAGHDDTGWQPVATRNRPRGKLQSQVMPAIKVMRTIHPVNLTSPRPGIHVYDMGQLFGGWTRLRLKGPRGCRVAVKYAARIFKDTGLVDKRRHGGSGETDYYILKGGGEEVYEPRFTYHPVRYVQVEGYPGQPAAADLEGRVVHSAVDMFGDFECSNRLLNRIHENVVWTFRNGLFGIPLDCLHREHWAWTDPATITGMLYPRKYMPLFWTKWLRDIADAQHDDGAVPDVAPSYNFNDCDPAWGGNYPLLVWYLHQYYGDTRIVEEHYGGMKKCVDHLTSIAHDHLVTEGHYGDHMLPGDAPGQEQFISRETPRPLVWTGYYYRGALVVSMAARLLGKTGDAEHYAALAGSIRDAFNRKWLDAGASIYATGSQTANIFPLALGIVPEARKAGLLKNIARSILEERRGHLRTGNTGTTCMIDMLARLGLADAMYRVATSTEYPGWGYMVRQGATTIWERWGLGGDAESMIMWATIDEFFYGDLAGIRGPEYYGPENAAPGFRDIRIHPYVLGDLTHARASIRTVRGVISSAWKRNGDTLFLETTLPVNSRAAVSIPRLGLNDVVILESGRAVWKGGKFLEGAPGIVAARKDGNRVTFSVGSGAYRFRLDPESPPGAGDSAKTGVP